MKWVDGRSWLSTKIIVPLDISGASGKALDQNSRSFDQACWKSSWIANRYATIKDRYAAKSPTPTMAARWERTQDRTC